MVLNAFEINSEVMFLRNIAMINITSKFLLYICACVIKWKITSSFFKIMKEKIQQLENKIFFIVYMVFPIDVPATF